MPARGLGVDLGDRRLAAGLAAGPLEHLPAADALAQVVLDEDHPGARQRP